MPRIPLIWAITASNFPETLTPKNSMTLSSTSPLGHRGKANMALNSTVSRNKIKDSVFYQIPKTATIWRAPEGIQRRQRCVQTCPHGNVLSSHTSSSTLPGVRVSSESLVQHGGPTRCLSEITLVPRKLQYLRRGRRPLFSV